MSQNVGNHNGYVIIFELKGNKSEMIESWAEFETCVYQQYNVMTCVRTNHTCANFNR